jgi:hypothetical protein
MTRHLIVPLIACLGLFAATDKSMAQRPKLKVHGVFDGDTMYTVIPPDAIPAIMEPDFLTGEEAARQMLPDEPVIGINIGGETKAYSMWQLDAHEIVNDSIAGIPIAPTW